MRVSVQLFVALTALVVVLVASLAALAQLKFSSFLADSTSERLDIVATTSAEDFSAAIDLGLSLGEVANGAAILDRARSHDPAIRSIAVFDPEGNVLHAVGEGVGGRLGEESLEALRLAGAGITDERWSHEGDDSIGSGIVIRGSFGQPVGGVLVEYPATEMSQQEDAMLRRLIVAGLLVALGMGLFVVVLVVRFHGRFRNLTDGAIGSAP